LDLEVCCFAFLYY